MYSALDIGACFREAWRGFKGWWIPLCLVATILVALNSVWAVRWFFREELPALQPYQQAWRTYVVEVLSDPLDTASVFAAADRMLLRVADITDQPETQAALRQMRRKIMRLFAALFIIVSALHVLMVIMAKASVHTPQERTLRRDTRRTLLLTLSYAVMALAKILPFCCCILPGLYVYTKLYFSDFIITETSANPLRAMAQSWRMTEGNFWRIFLLLLVTLTTHVASLLTMGLAEIPGRPFEYTLRAAAYRQLRQQKPPA
jgi:hypothetical protein